MDSANINTAEQNIAQVKTALKAFVENEKIAKMLGKDFVSEMNDWEALIEKKSEEPFTLVILGEFKRDVTTRTPTADSTRRTTSAKWWPMPIHCISR